MAPGGQEQLLEELRPRAFAVAYRMLGSVSEAEDVVQESLLRLHRALEAGEEIASPAAYLATIATRLSIDELRSARARRELYVGEWLPEPVVDVPEEDPANRAELADTLSFAFLAVLERLTPEQRAVFLLREVFDYPYAEIAEVVGRNEDATRQLAARARRRVDEAGPRQDFSPERRDQLAERFFAALEDGEVAELERLLAADVELHGDGGGKVPALARPISGRGRVARALGAWTRVAERFGGVSVQRTRINGVPGALLFAPDGGLISVLVPEVSGDEVVAVRSVVNPDKLRHVAPPADFAALLRRARRR